MEITMGGPMVFNHGSSNAQGVAIAFKKGIEMKFNSIHKLVEGRVLILKVMVNDQLIVLINSYAPNNDDVTFFQNIFSFAENCEYDQLILGGDLNKILDESVDRNAKVNAKPSNSARFINSYLEDNVWVDTWRVLNPEARQYTWHRQNPSICMSRLDYFLTPMVRANCVEKCEILPGLLSDHSFVTMELCLQKEI